jgi:uncharacterized membrane protein (DUF485 family)
MMPAIVLLLIAGIWMVRADSEWSFEHTWMRAALGLFALAFLVGGVYLSRAAIGMDRAVAAMAPRKARFSPCSIAGWPGTPWC